METTTVIELFEELKKQIAALARRLDDRNPPAPPVSSIPTEPDNRLDRLLETTQLTRTNVERVRMELTDRISALEKKLGQECGKCAALPSPQRHIHTIDFKSSKSTLCMFGLSLAVVCCGVHIHRLHTRIDSMCDAELKYRYIRMMGGIDEQGLRDLNALFLDSDRTDDLHTLREQVEQYETAIQEAIETRQRADIKAKQAEELKEKARQRSKPSK